MRTVSKGFALTEVLLVLVVVGVMVAVALPAYVRAATRDREEEVKSNIHLIQIALERYAVDSGGEYPCFLVGAERDSNILVSSIELRGNGVCSFPVSGMTPFARTIALGGRAGQITMDPLIRFGYLSEYPVNPFAAPDVSLWHSYRSGITGSAGMYPYGGMHGDKMFDLGFGWGDTPQTDFVLYTAEWAEEREAQGSGGTVFSDPDLDAPGNFYYHPVFADLVPVYFHYAAKYGEVFMVSRVRETEFGVLSDEVTGYMLYGYGAPGHRGNLDEGGLDYFNRMPLKNDLPNYLDKDLQEEPNLILDFIGKVGHSIRRSALEVSWAAIPCRSSWSRPVIRPRSLTPGPGRSPTVSIPTTRE